MLRLCFQLLPNLTQGPKLNQLSAAEFNTQVLKNLQKEYEKNPEVDLLQLLPTQYSENLAEKKKPIINKTISSMPIETIPASLMPTGTLNVVFPISQIVLSRYPISCASDIASMFKAGHIISGRWGKYVVKFDSEFIVKVCEDPDTTAFSNMKFLEQCGNPILASKALGMAIVGKYTYLFMSYVKGVTLDTVWNELKSEQKKHLQDQLDDILIKLRGLPRPKGYPLGGVMKEGCKDTRKLLRVDLRTPIDCHIRRPTRVSQIPIYNTVEFEDFIFSNPKPGTPSWIGILRQMLPTENITDVVFTHGDFRPIKILVELHGDGNYKVSGIIGWERGGFYPAYWEHFKATYMIHAIEESDWYFYLPKCIKSQGSDKRWLIDKRWEKYIDPKLLRPS
ncbi:hypothetical protein K3495_g13434 [Podosphaera aphanis]|nr:hypothetical protein K3495_g13434 [Podosphaera aphanis]